MAGNGHFQCQTPDGPVPCRIKPNTTGMDYLLARIMDIWNALYEKLMIPPKDRHNLVVNCMRFTATVWENLVTAQAAAGRLIAVPPADANFQSMSLTEIRDSLKPLIQYGPPRGPEGGTVVSFNSQEVNTTRVASRKRKMNNNNIVVLSSNVGSKNNEQKEEGNTLDAVCAVITPGVPAPAPKRLRTELNDTDVNANTARNQPLENRETAVNCIAYTSNFAGLFVGLLNHIGAIQTEVNPVISAYYDWGCYYIKQFVSSSMDVFVRDNYSRMREGYKSRGVVMTIWLKTLHTLSLGKSKNDSIQHLWMDIQGDALGLVNVPMVFCNLLYRGVHMSSLVMTSVLADHLRCPVVSVKNLNRFFELEGPPDLGQEDTSFREDFHNILEFIRLCLTNNRFCPAEDAPLCRLGNISCYISGDANIELMPANPKTSLLRVPPNKDKDETHDISHKVALRVAAQYGEQLFGQCHMGPDVATYRLALVYLMERFAPDFRGLMSPLMFHSAKHLGILGLAGEAPGMSNYLEPAHPPFARQCNIRLRDQQLQSQAIGVNVWSLLTVVSLVGSTDIHPDVSNCFSHSLLQTILAHAPAASTPGDMCPTPRFDHSATATRIFIPDVPRPKHFLRPNEPSFVKNGVLPIAKACGRFTPEDMLHVSQLSSVHKQLHCDIMEVPSNAFTSPYALEPDVRYTFHIPYPDEGEYGMIIVNTEAERVSVETFSRTDEDRNRAHSLTFTDWEEKIREMGMVITPLIRRAGAAVVVTTVDPETQVESQAIGCLIPTPESGEDLLDVSDCTYNALMTAEMDVAKLFFLDVLKESLLPVGEVLYLDMKVLEEEKYQALGRQGKLLFVRLNVPHVRNPEQGKLYVTCLHQPRTSHGRSVRGTTAITLAVNPWDVQLASSYTGNPANVIKHLS